MCYWNDGELEDAEIEGVSVPVSELAGIEKLALEAESRTLEIIAELEEQPAERFLAPVGP